MKIIKTDNLNRDESSEELIAENVNAINAEMIANLLNAHASKVEWFKAVSDDYQLYQFQP